METLEIGQDFSIECLIVDGFLWVCLILFLYIIQGSAQMRPFTITREHGIGRIYVVMICPCSSGKLKLLPHYK